ncbi:hypothetical protein DVH24_004481 [Malus domestica]|uniref:Aminoacyl-tRNA synthetase class II (D/K/N) domain-containing protein n=1 Tax=Malus domestica TaxID=3750 RepID=A0A498IF45_MALDO|nr:hypothetical protein DVH24_004481 [Malus domestica]
MVAKTPLKRITYTEIVDLLIDDVEKGKKFDNHVEWGIDLESAHKRYLTEVLFQKPVTVYNYPKGVKAFYRKLNDDLKTVAAVDVLVLEVGRELIGGRIEEIGLPAKPYEWYIDLPRFGTIKHCGFDLGFERMVLFAT